MVISRSLTKYLDNTFLIVKVAPPSIGRARKQIATITFQIKEVAQMRPKSRGEKCGGVSPERKVKGAGM